MTGTGAGNPFTGGSDVDPFTGLAPGGGSQNGFTGGSNIDPYGGAQDSEPFTGGPPSAASDAQADLASLYSGSLPLLSSPDLLAMNDVTTPAANPVASDASGAGAPGKRIGRASPLRSPTLHQTQVAPTYIGTIVDNPACMIYTVRRHRRCLQSMRCRADTDTTTPAPAPAGTPPQLAAPALFPRSSCPLMPHRPPHPLGGPGTATNS